MHNMKSARSKHIWEKYILPEFLQKYKMDTHISPVALVKVKETQKQTLSSDISLSALSTMSSFIWIIT